MGEENQDGNASGSETTDAGGTPTTPTTPPVAQPKIEVDAEGRVEVDGKKYVPESDLIGAKKSLQGDIEKAQAAHVAAIDKLNLQLSEANQNVAKANAALETAKQSQSTEGASPEDIAKAKQEAEEAKTALATATTSGLDYRRKYIMAVYNIQPDSEAGTSLATKTAEQLDAFEEALKAVGGVGAGGAGRYAFGNGGGGDAPRTEMDRARQLLDNTPIRGVRNNPQQ